jgi:hypothetical protein
MLQLSLAVLLIVLALNPTRSGAFIIPTTRTNGGGGAAATSRSLQHQHSIISSTATPSQQPASFRGASTLSRQQGNSNNNSPQHNTATRLSAVPFLIDVTTAAYTYSLSHYQLATESATTAFLAGIGDLVAQTLSAHHHQQQQKCDENQKFTIDWSRYQTFVLKGSVSGILWSKWYAFCDPFTLMLSQNMDGIPNIQLLLSILLEQFVWCPLMYSVWDIPFPMLLRGDDLREIPQNVQAAIGNLLIDNAKVWTVANIFIYNIPLQWRVVIVSLTDVVWQSVLSSSIAMGADDEENVLVPETVMASFEEQQDDTTPVAASAPARRQRQVSI